MKPPFEQDLTTLTQRLFCSVVLEKKIFKSIVNRNQIFAFFHFQSSTKMPVGGVSLSFKQTMMTWILTIFWHNLNNIISVSYGGHRQHTTNDG